MAMVAGAGVAVADDGSGAASGTSNSTEQKPDSDYGPKPKAKKEDKTPEPAGTAEPAENDTEAGTDDREPAAEVPEESAPTDEDTPPRDETPAEETPKKGSDHEETEPSSSYVIDKPATTAEVTKEPAENVAEPVADTEHPEVPAAESGPVDKAVVAAKPKQTPVTTALAIAAPELAAAPAGPTLINVIGTLFFSVFDFVSKIFEGPPVVPPGANVTVGRSPLRIDCGDGYLTQADWYFPTQGEPDKLIYLQHGAFARAGLYNVTAAELAERNNAIVVAPSITSNYFACDGCQMGGDQMHAAVVKLFLGDRGALLASAQAAGFQGTELPQRFVIAGHSGGGQTAGGAAGYYAQYAPADRLHDLAGVLLLDTSHVGGAIERGVRKIPLDIPVYHISAAPGPLNTYGGANEVLARERPGFVGVQLIGGVHGDAWQTTNAPAEFVVGLGTGFPKPQNVEAVQVLAQGWITDWFNNTHTDEFYGERGEVIAIETTAGVAQAYVIPGPAPQLTIFDLLIKALLESTAVLSQFSGNCAADPSAAAATATCPPAAPTAPKPRFNGKLHTKHGVIS
jgi:hypothetical protein